MLTEERVLSCSKKVSQPLQLSPSQSVTARAALGLSTEELASAAGLTSRQIAYFEKGHGLKKENLQAIRAALEAAGIEFRLNGLPSIRLRGA